MRADDAMTEDQERIRALGGPTKLARLLGYDRGGPQRVSNWIARGIPASVKVEHPELFMVPIERLPADLVVCAETQG